MTKTLDLGCGDKPRNPFGANEIYGVDIVDFGNPNIKIADLIIDPIPFEDESFDYVTGYDFLEHVPRILYNGRNRTQPFIDLMNEVYRVLKPGGQTHFVTPYFPHAQTFQDPQHVNYITEQTILYFIEPNHKIPNTYIHIGRDYGFNGKFHLVNQYQSKEHSFHLVWNLIKI